MARLFVWLTCIVSVLTPAVGIAQSGTDLKTLETANDTRGWEGVGRLNLDDKGFCTGALIDENTVLTAAHCLFDKTTGQPIAPSSIRFLAGWRNGRAEAYRTVTQAVAHPDYLYEQGDAVTRVARDLALLRLDRPIRTTAIQPFATSQHLRTGDKVGVVSYAKDREEIPSLQEVCHVLGREEGAVMLSCSVDFGASGAPVFILGTTPRIVSVVSSKAMTDEGQVALGAQLGGALAAMRTSLDAQRSGAFSNRKGLPKSGLSAKFVKP